MVESAATASLGRSVQCGQVNRTGIVENEQTHLALVLEGTPYRALAHLASGGMGDIYEATPTASSNEKVVVKVLRAELAGQADLVERMRVEGETISLLSHPHIVGGRGHGITAAQRPYVAMERLYGSTLREESRRRGPLPVCEAVRHTRQLLSALRAVHEAGLVHRDVKPDNIMVCGGNGAGQRIKLLDFGIAKVICGAGERRRHAVTPLAFPTREGICVGTPRYASPEQASGTQVDPRTDIYAAGIVLYTLLAGRGPFDEIKGTDGLLRAHRDLTPPRPSEVAQVTIPSSLEDVILRAISKDPRHRFASALSFSHELWRTLNRLFQSRATSPAHRFNNFVEPTFARCVPPAEGGTLPQGFAQRATVVAQAFLPVLVSQHGAGAPSKSKPGWRRTRWAFDLGVILGSAAIGAMAGLVTMWVIPLMTTGR